MPKMQSEKARDIKYNGELAKQKLANKLKCPSSKDIYLYKEVYPEISEHIQAEGKLMLRVGKNWQFHLGDLPEIGSKSYFSNSIKKKMIRDKVLECGTFDKKWDTQVEKLRSPLFWEKYFSKGNKVFCFSNDNYEYFFFNINDIVDFITKNTRWRLLETGRIKGDLMLEDGSKKLFLLSSLEMKVIKNALYLGRMEEAKGYNYF